MGENGLALRISSKKTFEGSTKKEYIEASGNFQAKGSYMHGNSPFLPWLNYSAITLTGVTYTKLTNRIAGE